MVIMLDFSIEVCDYMGLWVIKRYGSHVVNAKDVFFLAKKGVFG
jgi:hypothetical protein